MEGWGPLFKVLTEAKGHISMQGDGRFGIKVAISNVAITPANPPVFIDKTPYINR